MIEQKHNASSTNWSFEMPSTEGVYWYKRQIDGEETLWKVKHRDGSLWCYSIEYELWNHIARLEGGLWQPVAPPNP